MHRIIKNTLPQEHILTIIFSAKIDYTKIISQTINLGVPYPEIEIHATGIDCTHLFKIKNTIPNSSEETIKSSIESSSLNIQHFWVVLEHLLKRGIHPIEEILFQIDNGVEIPLVSRSTIQFGTASAQCIISDSWPSFNNGDFFKKYNIDLLKRLNFVRKIPDSVSRFISLYTLLLHSASDSQAIVDQMILNQDPKTEISKSPKNNKEETIFTRLRNELSHDRENVSILKTHQEIIQNVNNFQLLVEKILHEKLVN